jgi:Kef-type K+ transport system membrane component KefB
MSSAEYWAPTPDIRRPDIRRRFARAGAVGAVWALTVIPVVFGWQRCAIAAIFHRPCPGCGMTRAIRLLAAGHVDASIRMHPLAVPVLAVGALMVVSSLASTLSLGSPFRMHRSRLGQATVAIAIVVHGAVFVLWGLRWLGYLGGPVLVY